MNFHITIKNVKCPFILIYKHLHISNYTFIEFILHSVHGMLGIVYEM